LGRSHFCTFLFFCSVSSFSLTGILTISTGEWQFTLKIGCVFPFPRFSYERYWSPEYRGFISAIDLHQYLYTVFLMRAVQIDFFTEEIRLLKKYLCYSIRAILNSKIPRTFKPGENTTYIGHNNNSKKMEITPSQCCNCWTPYSTPVKSNALIFSSLQNNVR
jgi:hypothetical protein